MTDETPAETIRRAASLMRERAEMSPAGPWSVAAEGGPDEPVYVATSAFGLIATIRRTPTEGGRAEVRHIASWHPLVAAAVASWLESLDVPWSETGPASDELTHALRVSRAYLREPAP